MSRRLTFAIALIVLSIASIASAQSSATATASASARVLTPIAIARITDLNFGTLVPGSGGTVIVTPGGVRSATGGISLISSAVSAATFNVTGEVSTPYTITLPASILITNTVTPTQQMTVDTFASNPSGTGTLSGLGAQSLAVGATLHVTASQPSGLYTGTFNVTVAY